MLQPRHATWPIEIAGAVLVGRSAEWWRLNVARRNVEDMGWRAYLEIGLWLKHDLEKIV